MSVICRIIFFLFLILPSAVFSQGEFNNWCFGYNRLVSFNTGVPVNMPNTAMSTNGGTITVSDSLGRLLFYSEGRYVYNRNNGLMPNGSGLGGSTSSMSSSTTVVRTLYDDSLYYILNAAYYTVPSFMTRVEYSVLDMRLNGGLGDIVAGQKNIRLKGGYTGYGPITGIRHANNRDVWIVVRLTNPDSNYYAAYAITAAGVDTVPVFSPSLVHSPSGAPSAQQIKISPDGHTLVCTYNYPQYHDSLEICYFNPATGQVAPRFITRPMYQGTGLDCNGVEYSIDSKLMYMAGQSDISHVNIFQYDITASDSAQFVQGMMPVGIASHHHSDPQMAADWKIYFSPDGWDTLQVINNPSVRGNGCNFQRAGFPLVPGNHSDGFPQFVQKYKAYLHSAGNCQDLTVQFSGDIWPPADSIHWDFGDPPSGVTNNSTTLSPQHTFSSPGSYTVTLYVRHNDLRTDTTWKTIYVGQTPVITTTPLYDTICSGDPTHIVLTSGTPSATFHWTAALTMGNVTGFSADSGLLISQVLVDNTGTPGIVTYTITPKAGTCLGPSVNFPVTVYPKDTVGVVISASGNNLCNGAQVIFTASPVNPGSLPVYNWKVNGIAAGFNSPVYTYTPANGDQVACMLTSSIPSCITNNPATSNTIAMIVHPVLPVSIVVTASANPVCEGTSVTFTATAFNGGTLPAYLWKVNGIPVGTNISTYTYVPVNADIISCTVTSSDPCASGSPASSLPYQMIVDSNMPAGITIDASPNPFCPGTSVVLTANPVNGGSTPAFQWKVNGTNVPNATSAVFTYSPVPGDLVSCTLTSNLICVTGNPATSSTVMMTGKPAPNVSFTACFDSVTTTNAKPIKLKGGIPPGGVYSGPGVNSMTGMFTPSLAGTGVKNITYTYTNAAMCSAGNSRTITVQSPPVFTCGNNLTDIRDNRVYRTVKIGNQCWMAENLAFGTRISDLVPQTDNCIPEKYTDHPSFVTRHSSFYQWDELMRYSNTEASQGLCPPGWHIPAADEWDLLLDIYSGPGQAGSPMKDTLLLSGFDSYQKGFLYQNHSWVFDNGPYAGSMYWTSTMSGTDRAIARGLNDYNHSVSYYPALRENAFGVRCVMD